VHFQGVWNAAAHTFQIIPLQQCSLHNVGGVSLGTLRVILPNTGRLGRVVHVPSAIAVWVSLGPSQAACPVSSLFPGAWARVSSGAPFPSRPLKCQHSCPECIYGT
jgi:hypothetical protein